LYFFELLIYDSFEMQGCGMWIRFDLMRIGIRNPDPAFFLTADPDLDLCREGYFLLPFNE
jgi:hypothetical protein